MANACRPKIGIIIPTYGHPVLLTEAIESALVQQSTCDVVVLIVSDGCRWQETDVGAPLIARLPRTLFTFVRQMAAQVPREIAGLNFFLITGRRLKQYFS